MSQIDDSFSPSEAQDSFLGGSSGASTDSFDTSSKFGNRGPDAEIWTMYVSEAERHDRESIDRWDRSTENFILFTTLFSGILTAFVILSVNSLQVDNTQTTAEALTVISAQLFALNSGQSIVPPSYQPSQFSPTNADVWTNALWIVSLTISLLSTVSSMLVKQWLMAYRAQLPLAQQDRARLRQFRYLGVTRWYMSTIIEILPIAMHVSVIVFLGGLVVYLSERNTIIAYLVLAMAALGTILYIFVAIAPLIWLECPFVSPVTTGIDCLVSWLLQASGRTLSRLPCLSKTSSGTFRTWGKGCRRSLRIYKWLKDSKNTDRIDTLAFGYLQSVSHDRRVNMAVFLTFVGWKVPPAEAKIIALHMTRNAERWIRQILRAERGLQISLTSAIELAALSGWSKANFWMGSVRKAARDALSSYETIPDTSVFTRLSLLLYSTRFFFSRAGNLDSQDAERAARLFVSLMGNRDIPLFDFTLLLGFFHARALFKPGDGEDKACTIVRDGVRAKLKSAKRPFPFMASACAFLRASERPADMMKYADAPGAATAPPFANWQGSDEYIMKKLLSTARTAETRAAASHYAMNNIFHPTRPKPRLGWAYVKDLLAWFSEIKYIDSNPPWRLDHTAIADSTHIAPALKLLESCVTISVVRQNVLSVSEVVSICVLLGSNSPAAGRLLLDKNGYAHQLVTMKHVRLLTTEGARDANLAHVVTRCLNHVFVTERFHQTSPALVRLRRNANVAHRHWFGMIRTLLSQDSTVPVGHPLLDLVSEHMVALLHLDHDLVMRSGVVEVLHGRFKDLSSLAAQKISELVDAERAWRARHSSRRIVPRRAIWDVLHSDQPRPGSSAEAERTLDPELGLVEETEKRSILQQSTLSAPSGSVSSVTPVDAEKTEEKTRPPSDVEGTP